jgi:hypothetical protein
VTHIGIKVELKQIETQPQWRIGFDLHQMLPPEELPASTRWGWALPLLLEKGKGASGQGFRNGCQSDGYRRNRRERHTEIQVAMTV